MENVGSEKWEMEHKYLIFTLLGSIINYHNEYDGKWKCHISYLEI